MAKECRREGQPFEDRVTAGACQNEITTENWMNLVLIATTRGRQAYEYRFSAPDHRTAAGFGILGSCLWLNSPTPWLHSQLAIH